MLGGRLIERLEHQAHPAFLEPYVDPAPRLVGIENVSGGREVDKMNPIELPTTPLVRMPKNKRLDVLARTQDVDQRRSVPKSPLLCRT